MLQQISWSTYTISILTLATAYYLYVGLAFYRTELRAFLHRLAGKRPALKTTGDSDLQFPHEEIMGKAQPGPVEFLTAEDLSFGPPEDLSAGSAAEEGRTETERHLIGVLTEMAAEVKILISVINGSGESKENFEMLFRLIIKKYPSIAGTPYQQQINAFLIAEGIPELPFPLTRSELNNYWTDQN